MTNVDKVQFGKVGVVDTRDNSGAASTVSTGGEQKNYIEVGGLRVYNKVVGQVTAQEMSEVVYDAGTELHLARHFYTLPESYRQSLIGRQYDDRGKIVTITAEDISNALNTKGSKFLVGDAGLNTPKKLAEFVKSQAQLKATNSELVWVDGGFCKKTLFTIEMPQITGRDGVININDLFGRPVTKSPRGKLKGDDFLVNEVSGYCLDNLTPKISAVIGHVKGEDKPVIFLAHPGKLAPSFPRDGQAQEEIEYGVKFWNEHAFIT